MRTTTLALAVALALGGCGSDSNAEQDRGLDGDGVAPAFVAPDKNVDGIPYPTDRIGTSARKGDRPGDRIANFKFLGYPDANIAAGLQPISLAQLYDPSGKRHRLIHIQAAGSWCPYCQKETELVVPLKRDLDERRAVWLVSLAEGSARGTPSRQEDLDDWIRHFASPFTHVLDPGNAQLGPFYDASALPWNADVDARTMEILRASTGARTSAEAILSAIDEAIEMAEASKLR